MSDDRWTVTIEFDGVPWAEADLAPACNTLTFDCSWWPKEWGRQCKFIIERKKVKEAVTE